MPCFRSFPRIQACSGIIWLNVCHWSRLGDSECSDECEARSLDMFSVLLFKKSFVVFLYRMFQRIIIVNNCPIQKKYLLQWKLSIKHSSIKYCYISIINWKWSLILVAHWGNFFTQNGHYVSEQLTDTWCIRKVIGIIMIFYSSNSKARELFSYCYIWRLSIGVALVGIKSNR